ncbi:hypothetical protein N7466_001624 [Penicillium verhagenii]|uniref:uncharacterized protein n=1 Tax=Penicillium verhagenii TaxID=1562060 RepID=UPI002545688F|nr:uncharacterized protein N7466_001624 [Penicillium verhagenii]KAJ5938490.1 hypothetical protein N7466_001624 [Penicillium verhagenii]
MHQRSSEYHKYDAMLCYLVDTMHGEDEDISFKDPNLSGHCLDYISIFSATTKSIETKDLHLRRIRLWWKQANMLRLSFISDMSEYRHALSYHSIQHIPQEERQQYAMACYADVVYQIGVRAFPLTESPEEKTVSQGRFIVLSWLVP